MMSEREVGRLCARANEAGRRFEAPRSARQGGLAGCENRAQGLFVANGDSFPARLYDAARFPSGEQPAYGKQRGAGHLRQFFARKADFDQTAQQPAHLVQQSQELTSDSRSNSLGGNFAEPLLEFPQILAENMDHVLLQNREALDQSVESRRVPDEYPAQPKSLRRCMVPAVGKQANRTKYVARHAESEDYLSTARSKLSDLRKARGEQQDMQIG